MMKESRETPQSAPKIFLAMLLDLLYNAIKPTDHALENRGVQAVDNVLALAGIQHKGGRLKGGQMMTDGGGADIKPGSNFPGCHIPFAAEHLKDLPPRGGAQRFKSIVVHKTVFTCHIKNANRYLDKSLN
jgi:hypothetical protein